ncbi:hypothetical protein OH77DRAFT_1387200, partial [Trametes cingulata]
LEFLPDVRRDEVLREVEELALRAIREVVEDREKEAAAMAAPSVPVRPSEEESRITVRDALQSGPALEGTIRSEHGFDGAVRAAYATDTTFAKVMASPTAYPSFSVREGLLYVNNRFGDCVLCVPHGKLKQRSLRERVIDLAHKTLGHMGTQKTIEYVRRWFWW